MTLDPTLRPRRLRLTPAMRRMVRETVLTPSDFIYPMFIRHGKGINQPIKSMPGQSQLSPDTAATLAKQAYAMGIPAVVLFGITAHKDACGTENYAPDGIVPQAIKAIKDAVPDILVISDMCLCEYTDHGHCGLINLPVAAYQVSGEYAMLHAAGQNGWIDLRRCALETLTSIKRAGADMILTYFALDAARWLQEG